MPWNILTFKFDDKSIHSDINIKTKITKLILQNKNLVCCKIVKQKQHNLLIHLNKTKIMVINV